MSVKLYGFAGNPRTNAVKAVAEYEGINVEYVETAVFDKDNLPKDFVEKFPQTKVPVIEAGDKKFTETIAIAYYLASQSNKANLFGQSDEEKVRVLEWASFANSTLLPAIGEWFVPITRGPYNKKTVDEGKAATAKLYAYLDKVLESRTFLVSERITFADILTATVLQRGSNHVVDTAFFAQYPNVLRFFNTVLRQPQVVKAVGEPSIIEKCKEYVPPAKEKKEKAPAPAAAAAAPKAPKAKKEVEKDDEEEPLVAEEPKAKHPCEALGKPTFNLEDWKRKYSNEDTPVAMKWFEENYKPEEFSLWRVTYKYPEELTQVFMSSNLIGGFHNRLEASRKYLFGSACVYGTSNNSKIQGVYVCRGQEWKPVFDVAPDYESYDFQPLNFSDAKDREFIDGCWGWTNEMDGLAIADGKIFK